MQQEAAGLGLDVGEGERGQLRASQGAGEADQDQGGVAHPLRRGAVDRADELSQIAEAERVRRTAWCASHDPAQPSADLANRFMTDGVLHGVVAMLVPNRRAGPIDGGQRYALLGPFGQVRANHGGLAGNGTSPRPAHQWTQRLQAWA